MIIVGGKGFAKEVLEVLFQNSYDEKKIAFFDNVNSDIQNLLYGKFQVLKSQHDVSEFLNTVESNFCLGIGGPLSRAKLNLLFTSWGGILTSVISPASNIGHYGVELGKGVCLMSGCSLTNDIKIGAGCLINLHCTVGHDSVIGDFTELSPGVHISGNCSIGSYCNLGTNATILPKVVLGDNVMVGAGAVVTKDVPSNSLVVGIPAKVVRELPALTEFLF